MMNLMIWRWSESSILDHRIRLLGYGIWPWSYQYLYATNSTYPKLTLLCDKNKVHFRYIGFSNIENGNFSIFVYLYISTVDITYGCIYVYVHTSIHAQIQVFCAILYTYKSLINNSMIFHWKTQYCLSNMILLLDSFLF